MKAIKNLSLLLGFILLFATLLSSCNTVTGGYTSKKVERRN